MANHILQSSAGSSRACSSGTVSHEFLSNKLNNNSRKNKFNQSQYPKLKSYSEVTTAESESSQSQSPKLTRSYSEMTRKNTTLDLDYLLCQPSTSGTCISTVRCLLCSFSNVDGRIVEEHMNHVHFDLEEHKDVTSPVKKYPKSIASGSGHICPICNVFSSRSSEELTRHVDNHFQSEDQRDNVSDLDSDYRLAKQLSDDNEEERNLELQIEFEFLKSQYGMDDRECNFRKRSTINMQKAVNSGRMSASDYYAKQAELRSAEYRGVDDGNSCVKDVILRIRDKSRISTNVAHTYMCYNTDFYGSSYGDKGWGCGYRNIQMMLSALSRNKIYAELLSKQFASIFNIQDWSENFVPSIPKIQEMIEWAWQQGFDAEGCEQLDGKLCDTRKWIGATEVTALFSALRFKCVLVDVMKPTVTKLHYKMFDWIVSYFKREDNSFKPPLYLQHDGHSRTIVGVEILKNGEVLLLILDPATEAYKMKNMLTSANPFSTLKLVRKSLSNMSAKQYQIVSICRVIKSENEYQNRKVLHSTKIE